MKGRVSQFGATYAGAVGAGLASAVLFSLVTQGTIFRVGARLSVAPADHDRDDRFRPGRGAGGDGARRPRRRRHRLHAAGSRSVRRRARRGGALRFDLRAEPGCRPFWLGFLAALSRPKDSSEWSIATGAGRAFARDYYPLERLLDYAVAISATSPSSQQLSSVLATAASMRR